MKRFRTVLISAAAVLVCFTAGFLAGRAFSGGDVTIAPAETAGIREAPSSPGREITAAVTDSGEEAHDGLVDINTATAEVLATLPGIGEATAQRIIDYREENGAFSTPSEIMNVYGIGETKYAAIESCITVG